MALDPQAFTAFERAAHDRIAGSYAAFFAPLTKLAVAPLLNAASVAPEQKLLDVATGPGVAAAAAHGRRARVTGIDISPGMIALARAAHPGIDFKVAEATALPFPDATFDNVVCNFALGHFPEPEAAMAECVRVLVPGGRLAFSWWDQPVRQRVQGLFREAIAELSLPPAPDVPQGHDTLRYSDPDAFAALLSNAGLHEVTITVHRMTFLMADVEMLWRAGLGGMAVTAGAVAAQDASTQSRVRDMIARRAEVYRSAEGFDIPIAFLIGAGQKR